MASDKSSPAITAHRPISKAEHVIRTLMEIWHQKKTFSSRQNRRISLNRFINFSD